MAGDRVRVSIGPVYGNLVTGAFVKINAHIVDGGGAHDVDYPIDLAVTSDTSVQSRYLTFVHTAFTTTPTIYLQAKVEAAGAGYVHLDPFGGTATSQWLRVEVIR